MMETTTEQTLDVRPIEPKHKHPTIFKLWQELPHGGSFVLVNDHDPVPLYYQFACEHVGGFRWDYLDRGPQVWRVRISKGEFPDPGFKPERKAAAVTVAPAEFAQPITVDTRPIFARGDTPCQAIDAAMKAHAASTTEHGGMTSAVFAAALVTAALPAVPTKGECRTWLTDAVLKAAWEAHLAVTDLGAYVTAGPVGLPIDWPCSAPFYAKTDTSAGVFTVIEWTGW